MRPHESERQLDHRATALSLDAGEGFTTLLENIRAPRTSEHRTRILVFSSASTADAVAPVTSALAAQAERRAIGTLRATLTTVAGRSLMVRSAAPHASPVGPSI